MLHLPGISLRQFIAEWTDVEIFTVDIKWLSQSFYINSEDLNISSEDSDACQLD